MVDDVRRGKKEVVDGSESLSSLSVEMKGPWIAARIESRVDAG